MLIKNIKEIIGVDVESRLKVAGKEMLELGRLRDAWLLTEGERIADFGTGDAPAGDARGQIGRYRPAQPALAYLNAGDGLAGEEGRDTAARDLDFG